MAEVTESKITDEHRAMMGKKSDPIEVVPRTADAQRMRDLLGDADPRWADGTGIAPPYILAMLEPPYILAMMEPRLPAELSPQVLSSGILTQTEWKFSQPIRLEEPLQAVTQLIDVRDRLGGRYGYSVLVMFQTAYLNGEGEETAASLRTITQFDRPQS